jgi:chromosome segregation ATPase
LADQKQIQAGLDRANRKLQEQLAASSGQISELEGQLEQYSAVTSSNEGVIADYQQQITDLKAQRDEWQQQTQAAMDRQERLAIVVGEYPNLAPLVRADALPQAETVEEFREKLSGLAEVIPQQGAPVSRPPASPPAQGAPNLATLGQQIVAASAAGNEDEIKRLKAQWDEATDHLTVSMPE